MAPQSITTVYLPGIAANFELERALCCFLYRAAISSREVKIIVAGFTRIYNKKFPKAGRLKSPYDSSLAAKSKASMTRRGTFAAFGADAPILRFRAFVCQMVGILFLLRLSEHVVSKGAAVPLTRRMITFFDTKKRPVSYTNIGKAEYKAQRVHINVTFAKADQSGMGRRTQHSRQPDFPEACIVTILERLISLTRDQYNATESMGIYEIPGLPNINAATLHSVMQNTVEDLGIPGSHKFTSHSLRYGGATMLASAGFPHYIIAIYGGWSEESKTLKFYTRPSDQMLEIVSAHMAKMSKNDSANYFLNEAFMIAKTNNKK